MQTKIIIAIRYDNSNEDPKDWLPYALGTTRNGQKGWFYLDDEYMATNVEDHAKYFDSFEDAAAEVDGIMACPSEWPVIGIEFIQVEVEVEDESSED